MNEEMWESLETFREFDVRGHLIWITSERYDDIKTPFGYKIVKEDYERVGSLRYPRVFFVNIVPVVAELFKNVRSKEISYFFAGTPTKKVKQK